MRLPTLLFASWIFMSILLLLIYGLITYPSNSKGSQICIALLTGLTIAFGTWTARVMYDVYREPNIALQRANISREGSTIRFDIFMTNSGKVAVFDPLINISGLSRSQVIAADPPFNWNNEGILLKYNHMRPLLPEVPMRFSFTVNSVPSGLYFSVFGSNINKIERYICLEGVNP